MKIILTILIPKYMDFTAIQHCNSRTGFELIVHEFDPKNCEECNIVLRDIIQFNVFNILKSE